MPPPRTPEEQAAINALLREEQGIIRGTTESLNARRMLLEQELQNRIDTNQVASDLTGHIENQVELGRVNLELARQELEASTDPRAAPSTA